MTTSRKKITVVNADDNEPIRLRIEASIAPLVSADGPEIEVITLPGGPKLMQTQQDIDSVAAPLKKLVEGDTETDVFVVACFADPGLAEARAVSKGRKVLGINQSGINAALALGDKVGVIAVQDAAVPRHRKYYESLGISDRVVGERAIDLDLGDAEHADDPTTAIDPNAVAAALVKVGTALRDEDGADVIVLGEGGVSFARDLLEQALGIPVVDPTAAAVGLAIVAATSFPLPTPPAAS
ncbi:MAG: aspartate/glutamate racemase family protein [Nocardioidaceae bacterium]